MIITERNAVKRPVQQQKKRKKKRKEIWNQDCTCQSKQLTSRRHSVSHTGVTVKVDPQHWRNANTGEDPQVFQFPFNDQRPFQF